MTIPAHPFPTGPKSCPSTAHVHCARCGTADGTVAVTVVRDGTPWPPTCSACSSKAARIAALRYVREGAA